MDSGIANPTSTIHPGIAVFDFDGTLIEGDSLLPFVAEIVGRRAMKFALLRALQSAGQAHLRGRPLGTDLKTSIKIAFLEHTLNGVPYPEAQAAARRLLAWRRWKPAIKQALDNHRAQGHHILVATGALDLYMPTMLEDTPVDGLLATTMEVVDGHLTGRLAAENCVRAAKAAQVAAFMAAHGPFAESWGYGNRPSDLPMLALMKHQTII